MGIGILEPDHTKRNCVMFLIALVIFGTFSAFYFLQNHGCHEYSANLKSCTKYVCTQRVMGFESKYVGHTALTLRREIVGIEKDKFMDEEFCNVIETDDITKDETFKCKYSDKTKAQVIERSNILFGLTPVNSATTAKDADGERASYTARTPEQEKECAK